MSIDKKKGTKKERSVSRKRRAVTFDIMASNVEEMDNMENKGGLRA